MPCSFGFANHVSSSAPLICGASGVNSLSSLVLCVHASLKPRKPTVCYHCYSDDRHVYVSFNRNNIYKYIYTKKLGDGPFAIVADCYQISSQF